MGQLRDLANLYKRPLSDFFLPEPPQESPIPHDFRRAPGSIAGLYTPDLRKQLRFARERQDLARALSEEFPEIRPVLHTKGFLHIRPRKSRPAYPFPCRSFIHATKPNWQRTQC